MTNLQTAFKHIRRAPYQAMSATLLSTITFLIISIFSLLVLGTNSMLHYLESRPQVTAFFLDSTTSEEINAFKSTIESSGLAEEVVYISKEQALEIYREQNQDNPLLLEMVTADILPASLEASAPDVDNLAEIAQLMNRESIVEEVVYQKDVIDTLRNWTNGIRAGGITLSIIFLLASILTITIIIGLKTATRKAEISTLSLLGASPWYIKGPFIIEGITYSGIGAFLGWGITYIILLYLTPNLVSFFTNTPIFPISFLTMLAVLAGQLCLGVLVGFFASLLATRRYGQ